MLEKSQAEAHTKELFLPWTFKAFIFLNRNPARLNYEANIDMPSLLSHVTAFMWCNM